MEQIKKNTSVDNFQYSAFQKRRQILASLHEKALLEGFLPV